MNGDSLRVMAGPRDLVLSVPSDEAILPRFHAAPNGANPLGIPTAGNGARLGPRDQSQQVGRGY
jgi:hypothetical protein